MTTLQTQEDSVINDTLEKTDLSKDDKLESVTENKDDGEGSDKGSVVDEGDVVDEGVDDEDEDMEGAESAPGEEPLPKKKKTHKAVKRRTYGGKYYRGGKGGKMMTAMKMLAVRNRPAYSRDTLQGITKPAIKRLARRAGIKRIAGTMPDEVRHVLKLFLNDVVKRAVTYTEHARRKTVTSMDVVYALKQQGRTLYGFGK